MAAALAAGVSIGWRLHDACAVLVGANAAAEHQARQEAASAKAVRLLASAGARQRTIYSVIEKEVPRLVAQDVVDRCPVPVGFVRLHDAAAQGMPTLRDLVAAMENKPLDCRELVPSMKEQDRCQRMALW